MNPFSPSPHNIPADVTSNATHSTLSSITTGAAPINRQLFSANPGAEELNQECLFDLYRTATNIRTQLLPHVASRFDIGRNIENRINDEVHNVNKVMVSQKGALAVHVLKDLGGWKKDNQKLQNLTSMIEFAHAKESQELEREYHDITERQKLKQYNNWRAAHDKKAEQLIELKEMVKRDKANQDELTQMASSTSQTNQNGDFVMETNSISQQNQNGDFAILSQTNSNYQQNQNGHFPFLAQTNTNSQPNENSDVAFQFNTLH